MLFNKGVVSVAVGRYSVYAYIGYAPCRGQIMASGNAEVQFEKIGSTDVLQVVGTDLTFTKLPGCISGGYHYLLNGLNRKSEFLEFSNEF